MPIDARPATGRSVLLHRKKALVAMTAGIALLAGLTSAEAFFNWPWNPYPQPHVSRPRATAPRPARPAVTKPADPAQVRENSTANEKDKPATKETPGDVAAKAPGVLTIAISLDKQRLTVYSDGAAIARSSVSTGHQTPTGVFSIIQKDRLHRPNQSGDAPMQYMQRITWSGVAMHQAAAANQPVPQGGIRLPEAFARQLWGMTRVGARVIITRGEVAPTAIASKRLLTRRAEPLETKGEPVQTSAQVVEFRLQCIGRRGRSQAHA